MNCCWLIILLLLCENCGGGDVPARNRRSYSHGNSHGDSHEGRYRGEAVPQFVSQETLVEEARYGYEQPPRGFAGFPASETCGCESGAKDFPDSAQGAE